MSPMDEMTPFQEKLYFYSSLVMTVFMVIGFVCTFYVLAAIVIWAISDVTMPLKHLFWGLV